MTQVIVTKEGANKPKSVSQLDGQLNEAYEHEENSAKTSSGNSSNLSFSGDIGSGESSKSEKQEDDDDQYDEKEATIEFSSITSQSNDEVFEPLKQQLEKNLANIKLEESSIIKVNDKQTSDENEFNGSFDGKSLSPSSSSETDGLDRNGFIISWSNLDYVVESKWYKLTQQRKPILNNLSGSFRSGELSAVLGPSGAGKSTLIDCLLGKRDRGVTGCTRVSFGNSSLEEERRTKRPLRIATIPQEDHLLDTLTVTETFMFASRLKNAHLTYANDDDDRVSDRKNSVRRKKRKPFDHFANVQRVIQQLNLSTCASLKCGKLSGGQYKRVSIGQELLSRPDLMILDEPTSGLDSVTCYQTICALRQLIDSSGYPMAIVATIHQPDIEVFNLFHKAYVLASGGRAIYEGPTDGIFRTLASGLELVDFRRKQQTSNRGATSLAIEQNDSSASSSLNNLKEQLNQTPSLAGNPARLIVEVAAGEYGFEITGAMTELQVRAHSQQKQQQQRFGRSGNGEVEFLALDMEPEVEGKEKIKLPIFDYGAHDPARRRANLDKLLNASKATNNNRSMRVYMRHLMLHTKRSWVTIVRDPMLFSLQLLLHILVPLLISYSFMNQQGYDACPRVGPLDVIEEAYRHRNILDELNQEVRGAFENLGYVFFQIYVIIFAAVCVTSLTYPLVMHVLLKEYRNGWYSMSSYFLGRTLADLPVPTVNVIIAMAISYHLTGQPLSPYNWRFASVAALTVLATLVAQTQGLMFGAMLMNLPQSAVFVAPASTAPLVVVSGFLLRIKSLPVPLQFLSKLSYFTHLFNGFVISRYGFNRCPCDEKQFVLDPTHEIPSQTRGIMDLWVESFGSEYSAQLEAAQNNGTMLMGAAGNQTTNEVMAVPQVDLIGKLVDTVTRAKTFGFEITDCSQVKPFPMLDYDLNDYDLIICFAALIVMLFGYRWLTYLTLSWKINSCI